MCVQSILMTTPVPVKKSGVVPAAKSAHLISALQVRLGFHEAAVRARVGSCGFLGVRESHGTVREERHPVELHDVLVQRSSRGVVAGSDRVRRHHPVRSSCCATVPAGASKPVLLPRDVNTDRDRRPSPLKDTVEVDEHVAAVIGAGEAGGPGCCRGERRRADRASPEELLTSERTHDSPRRGRSFKRRIAPVGERMMRLASSTKAHDRNGPASARSCSRLLWATR